MGEAVHPFLYFAIHPSTDSNVKEVVLLDDFVGEDGKTKFHVFVFNEGRVKVEILMSAV